jgi:hypothetical protein
MPKVPKPSERVGPIDMPARWSRGAPEPHLMQSESRAFLAFFLRESDIVEESTGLPTSGGPSQVLEPIGVVEWIRCVAVTFGRPDEVRDRHRLWRSGLRDVEPHAAAEVSNSRWIADLDRMDHDDPEHRRAGLDHRRHFVLGFHDSTFECVADGFRVWTTNAPFDEVLTILSSHLLNRKDLPFQVVT